MKRKASTGLENQIVKKQKVASVPTYENDRIEMELTSSEELSSDLPDVDVLISHLLKPHEVELLSEDPWNISVSHVTWTNEYTIVVDPQDSDQNSKAATTTTTSTTLPNDFFWHILLNSAVQELVRWRLVSKYFDRLVSISPRLWQSLFYRQRWRLPHEIRNFNERGDPRYSEIVINEKKVDWFSECKRNYLGAKGIKRLVEEISKTLPELIKPFAKRRKTGGKMKRARMFNAGLTDEELDAWEELHEFKLTNDFRELYKCMNGARFKFVPKIDEEIWDYECARPPPVCFPKLDTVKVLPIKWIQFMDEENAVPCAAVTQLATSSFKKQSTKVPQMSQSELGSDGSSYSMSGQEDSDSDQSEETIDNTAVLKVLHLGEYCVDEEAEYIEDMIYEPVSGAIMPLDTERFRRTSPAVPIVEYLQQVCDMIDNDKRVPLLFTFTDYIVNGQKLRQQLTVPPEQYVVDNELKFWLAECKEAFLSFHDCIDYMPVRAVQLIKAAAEDFVVKVFTKAQSMETSDALQADTFVAAAKELGRLYFNDQFLPFEKATDVTSRLSDSLLRFWIPREDGTNMIVYKQLDTSIIDL